MFKDLKYIHNVCILYQNIMNLYQNTIIFIIDEIYNLISIGIFKTFLYYSDIVYC